MRVSRQSYTQHTLEDNIGVLEAAATPAAVLLADAWFELGRQCCV